MISPESGKSEIVDLGDKKVIKKYNELRAKKEALEQEIIKKNGIDAIAISTSDNIYKELLLFFKNRSARY